MYLSVCLSLCRFAKDQGLTDELLPMTFLDFVGIAALVLVIFGIMGRYACVCVVCVSKRHRERECVCV
jgi:hypothetical protein